MASHYLAKIIIATLFTTTICNASIHTYHVNSANMLKNINSGENVSAIFTAESACNPVIHSITH